MIDQVELPVRFYCFTYNNRVLAAGILSNVKNHGLNWFINNCTQWEFSVNNKDKSFTIELLKNTPWEISFVSEKSYKCFLIKNCFHELVKNLISKFHYVYFWGADPHFFNMPYLSFSDGLIVGYNDEKKTYSVIYTRDQKCVKEVIDQEKLFATIFSDFAQPSNMLHAFYINDNSFLNLDKGKILNNIKEYLSPVKTDECIFRGIDVYDILKNLAEYEIVCKPENCLNNIYKLFLEHKVLMQRRICALEDFYQNNDNKLSRNYNLIIKEIEKFSETSIKTFLFKCDLEKIKSIESSILCEIIKELNYEQK